MTDLPSSQFVLFTWFCKENAKTYLKYILIKNFAKDINHLVFFHIFVLVIYQLINIYESRNGYKKYLIFLS